MAATFEHDGVSFQYPENWRVEQQPTESGWTVTLQSPQTAFLVLSVDTQMPPTGHVAETALKTLRDVYPDLEAEECVDSIAGQPSFGHNIRFFSLDLTNTCWTRSFYSPQGTVLVMGQFNDLEQEINGKVLQAICMSLTIDEK